jgi:hypothetical protein
MPSLLTGTLLCSTALKPLLSRQREREDRAAAADHTLELAPA